MANSELARASLEIAAIVQELSSEVGIPEQEQLRKLRDRLKPYPAETQLAIKAAFDYGRATRAEQADIRREQMTERNNQRQHQERRLGFLWGVGFILMLVAIALFVPNPSLYQYTLFRIVLALAAAGFTNYVEGMLNVKWKFLRAAGPLAVFIIVYFFSPAALVSNPPH